MRLRRRDVAGQGGRRSALWVSTSTATPGGIAAYVRTMADTPLWSQWSITHICTHQDGSVVRKAAIFAAGATEFMWRILVCRPAVVHLHTASYGSFARKSVLVWLAAAARVPVVLHVHGGEFCAFYRGRGFLVRKYMRATLTRSDRVVALGDSWAQRLERVAPASRVVAVPNPVRVREMALEQDSVRPVEVLFLGRVMAEKGVFTLLDAWRIVEDTMPGSAVLTIAGDGELRAARAYASELGLGDTVAFPGWVEPDRVEVLLERARMLVLPSRCEGQPIAVLEAMAHGLCVVASSVGGLPELLGEGRGIQVRPDDAAELATALLLAVEDRDLRMRLGAAAYARVREQNDVEVVWRRIDSVYREVVG